MAIASWHWQGSWQFLYKQTTPSTFTQACEGVEIGIVHNKQYNWVSLLEEPVQIEKEINYTLATNISSQNMWQMPSAINLDSSGLHRSSQTEVLRCRDKVYSHTTQAHQASPLHSASTICFKSALVLFSSFCSVGHRLPSIAHSLQDKVTKTSTTQKSTFSKAINSFHWVNLLYDGTINCFSTVAQSSVISDKTFTYKQAMHEKDYHEFVNAMIKEVDNHENRNHWTIMHHCDIPMDTKTIMSIWSFKR
jgi:hypothetical protein